MESVYLQWTGFQEKIGLKMGESFSEAKYVSEHLFRRWARPHLIHLVKYLIIYLLSGIAGSILSLAFNHNTICAGASGAIFGLLGALLYFGNYYRTYLGATLTRSIIPVIVLNLIIGFTSSGIDNAAHIGGLVGGILIAMAVGVPDKSNNNNKINGIVLSLIYFGFIIYLSFFR